MAAVRVTRRGRLVRLAVRAEDRDGRPAMVSVSFGDGVSERRRFAARGRHSGIAAFGHRFRRDGAYVVTLSATAEARALCGGTELSARRRLRLGVS